MEDVLSRIFKQSNNNSDAEVDLGIEKMIIVLFYVLIQTGNTILQTAL